ncbi:McrC family protein [Sansalvadorimonas verongulae]|uniref:McrC family protein n=1 Tax=Sansalvadorimonas verongulae TaxID=2172824 RepID=UPI0012BD4D18|nr:McrC family protein [Sansalvadorimonas verongulae]MTI13151.1 restriction endonuclease [Sansalvadorimonas verongulae]
MSQALVVREYAELTTVPDKTSLKQTSIPESCFDWLVEQFGGSSTSGKLIVNVTGLRKLKLGSYVGFIQSPCGTSIEILPKHILTAKSENQLEESRKVLLKMIAVSMNLPFQQVGSANLQLMKYPLPEWIYARFLGELDRLYKKGLRFSYETVEEESRFLRGQLNTSIQLRQPPGQDHRFHIRHEIFTPNRPENRLIKLALGIVREKVQQADNWRLANELGHLLEELPESLSPDLDFRRWGDSRLMTTYRDIRPWCELIIHQLNPLAQKGGHEGISLLFPMEKLFEHYVVHALRKEVKHHWRLRTQLSGESLCTHKPSGKTARKMFRLIPDIVLTCGKNRQILDTKWKVLNCADINDKYGLKQPDFYQMFAYGKKYMEGRGELMLIYPLTDSFDAPLPVFTFDDDMRLWIVPFDLKKGTLVDGEYCEAFPSLYTKPKALAG